MIHPSFDWKPPDRNAKFLVTSQRFRSDGTTTVSRMPMVENTPTLEMWDTWCKLNFDIPVEIGVFLIKNRDGALSHKLIVEDL